MKLIFLEYLCIRVFRGHDIAAIAKKPGNARLFLYLINQRSREHYASHREVSFCLFEGVDTGDVGDFPTVDGAAALRLPERQIRMNSGLFYRPRTVSASATFMVKSGLGFIWKRLFSLFQVE